MLAPKAITFHCTSNRKQKPNTISKKYQINHSNSPIVRHSSLFIQYQRWKHHFSTLYSLYQFIFPFIFVRFQPLYDFSNFFHTANFYLLLLLLFPVFLHYACSKSVTGLKIISSLQSRVIKLNEETTQIFLVSYVYLNITIVVYSIHGRKKYFSKNDQISNTRWYTLCIIILGWQLTGCGFSL